MKKNLFDDFVELEIYEIIRTTHMTASAEAHIADKKLRKWIIAETKKLHNVLKEECESDVFTFLFFKLIELIELCSILFDFLIQQKKQNTSYFQEFIRKTDVYRLEEVLYCYNKLTPSLKREIFDVGKIELFWDEYLYFMQFKKKDLTKINEYKKSIKDLEKDNKSQKTTIQCLTEYIEIYKIDESDNQKRGKTKQYSEDEIVNKFREFILQPGPKKFGSRQLGKFYSSQSTWSRALTDPSMLLKFKKVIDDLHDKHEDIIHYEVEITDRINKIKTKQKQSKEISCNKEIKDTNGKKEHKDNLTDTVNVENDTDIQLDLNRINNMGKKDLINLLINDYNFSKDTLVHLSLEELKNLASFSIRHKLPFEDKNKQISLDDLRKLASTSNENE